MPATKKELNGPYFEFFKNSTTAGDSLNFLTRGHFIYHTIQVINAGADTISILGSNDGDNWSKLTDDISEVNAIVQLVGAFRFIKAYRAGITPVTVTIYSSSLALM